jgi:hypothetical protein
MTPGRRFEIWLEPDWMEDMVGRKPRGNSGVPGGRSMDQGHVAADSLRRLDPYDAVAQLRLPNRMSRRVEIGHGKGTGSGVMREHLRDGCGHDPRGFLEPRDLECVPLDRRAPIGGNL